MEKYQDKSFQYISDAIKWLNKNPEIVVLSIVGADRFGEGCTVVYLNSLYKIPCEHEWVYNPTMSGEHYYCTKCGAIKNTFFPGY